jgi:hypothetical protein
MASGTSHGRRRAVRLFPAASFEACASRAMGVFGLALMKGWQAGKIISWLATRNLLDRVSLRSLRIVKERYGLAGN